MNSFKSARLFLFVILGCFLSSTVSIAQIPDQDIEKIKNALPSKATVSVKQPRKLLVFSKCNGYKHSAIPYAAKMLELLGKKTGAFETVYSEDLSIFLPENLNQFDAVCFNNTTQLAFDDPDLRKSLMDFVKGGKGVVGIHAATDNFYSWSEGAEMMGGIFDGHPWNASGTWKVKIEDPGHPLTAAFNGKDFTVVDEIYRIRPRNLRENCRVLLRLDMNDKTNLAAKGVKITDRDIPISYIRKMGQGRVFYCSLGHNNHIYWDSAIIKHYLDGIQYAFGDLTADATPVPFDIEKAVDIKEFDNLLNLIATYEYGQSRENLTNISDLLRITSVSDKLSAEIETKFIDFLKSNATLAAKQFICERLSIIGSNKSVPTLVAMLDNSETADMALFALERIPDEGVNLNLRELVSKSEGRIKIGVISALGVRQDPKAVTILIPLVNNPDNSIASAAVWSLGQIGGIVAAQTLAEAKSQKRLNLEITNAYLECAERFLKDGDKKRALQIYNQLYNSNEQRQVQYAALRGIILTSEEEASQLILNVLRSDNDELFPGAIQLVREIPPSEDLSAIAKALPEFSNTSQVQLLAALAGHKEPEVIKVMINQTKSGDEDVRIEALKALALSGDEEVVPILAQLAATKKGTEKVTARESLYRISGPNIDETIIQNLIDSNSELKIEYINAVSERQIGQGIPILLSACESHDPTVRLASIKAIREIAQYRYLEKAVDLLIDPRSEQERKELEKAVVSIALRSPEGESGSKIIFSNLKNIKELPTRISLIDVLGKIGDATALPILRSSLADKNPEIQTAAVRALSGWPDSQPVKDLLNVAQTSSDDKIRILSLRGYVKLISLVTDKSREEILGMYQKAMTLATDNNEKRMVLSGLSEVKSLDALRFTTQYLNDQELQQEAATAIISIAANLDEGELKQIKPTLNKVITIVKNESSIEKCRQLINTLERFEDYITLWQVSGPYTKNGVDLFDFSFAPENPNNEGVEWKQVPDSTDKKNYWHIDLAKIFGVSGRVAYLRNKIWSAIDQKVQLELGSNDAIKAWINGKLVHSNNVSRGVNPGDDKVKVTLNKGWNTLMLKIIDMGGAWGACARIRDVNGSHLEGLKIAVEE